MIVGRSEWSSGEGGIASNKVEHHHQNINTIQSISSVHTAKTVSPVLVGVIIGALVSGIALATTLPIYIKELSKQVTTTVLTTVITSVLNTTTASTTSTSSKTTGTTSTSTSTTSTGTSSSTTSTVTSTTTTAPSSAVCANINSPFKLSPNQFIYSPTSQQYAAGILNNQFGVYQAYGYANVTSTALWTASQSSTLYAVSLAGQTDRNLVLYGVNVSGVYWAANVNNGGSGIPFCLEMLDTGNLIWIDNSTTIIWQSNSAVQTG